MTNATVSDTKVSFHRLAEAKLYERRARLLDPVGAAAHIHRSLKADGTWMLMEPLAGDATEDNLGPVGRVAYAFSTMACVPVSLSQEVGMALGAQAGQAKLTEVIKAGGFSQVRRAAETPQNMILEARP